MMVPDEQLVKMACEGNQMAAAQLFRRYHDRVFSYLFRMIGDRGLAEDAAQETFFKGFRALRKYREKGQFKSWIFTIAHREGLRMLKKEKRYGMIASSPNVEEYHERELADPSPRPEDILVHQEQVRGLERALAHLTDPEKQVVLLRLYEGLPFKDIAHIMKCPLNTVLGRMHNAAKKLKKELSKEGDTP
jgi:RNA polymerase sigma-70 factor (ECF subfamily)